VRAAVGAVLGGALESDASPGRFEMQPGVVASLGGSRRWSLGDGRWFVTGSLTASGATLMTEDAAGARARLTAFDLRAGAIAGRTFADVIAPYLLARAFGGPVFWTVAGERVTGTDTHKFQLGAGVSVSAPWGLSAIVDVAVLGETSASLGLSWRL
jgi:hypothetical protein